MHHSSTSFHNPQKADHAPAGKPSTRFFTRNAWAFLLACALLFSACNRDCKDTDCQNGGICKDGQCFCPDGFDGVNCEISTAVVPPSTHDGNTMGWNGAEEDHSKVPVHVSSISLGGASPLPASVDLGPHFPPVGNQGSYGTCVAWSVAYAGLTAMEAIDLGADPSQSINQGSPKALFWSLPLNVRGDGRGGDPCNGTNFVPALDEMLNHGVASMSLVPYTDMGNCDGTVPLSWDAEAHTNMITHYRKLDNTVDEIKSQLSQNHPVIMGCEIQKNWGTLDANGVYSAAGESYSPKGYHAMIIQGYDDSKGNGAFHVRNSWGPTWNGDGTIWVDYNLMVDPSFSLESFFVMSNDGHKADPTSTTSGGPDLLPWVFGDNGFSGSVARNIYLNFYNIGDVAIPASANYKNYVMYVNAYNASDFGIMYELNFNTNAPAGLIGCNGPGDVCNINIDLPAGGNMAVQYNSSDRLSTSYVTPSTLNGDYYIVLFSDPLNQIAEANESNNVFYTSGHLPKQFSNGSSSKTGPQSAPLNFLNTLTPTRENLKKHPFMSAITEGTPNAYSVEELYETFKNAEASGVWAQKVAEFESRSKLSGK